MDVGEKRARGEGQSSSGLLDEADFERIRGDMQKYDLQREKIIKTSRDVQKLGKQAIFSLHRKDFKRAEEQLDKAAGTATSLLPLVEAQPTLRQGSYSNALEEWAEAKIFQHYLHEGTLMPSSKLPFCNNEEYLGGVLDFCGELNRFCVQRATARDEAAVRSCRDLVEDIMDQYLKFDFRNSQLRRKYDGLKYTLKNMETMLYELSLGAHKAGQVKTKVGAGPEPEGKRAKAEED